MSKATRATQVLEKAGIAFTLHSYAYDPNAERVGLQAAEAIGEVPERVLKTLMARVDGKPVCVIVPSDREVSMKKLAAAFGGKSAEMMKPSVRTRMMMTSALFVIGPASATMLTPVPICMAAMPRAAAVPKRVATIAKMSTSLPAKPSV